jgi:hypothetical protein
MASEWKDKKKENTMSQLLIFDDTCFVRYNTMNENLKQSQCEQQ